MRCPDAIGFSEGVAVLETGQGFMKRCRKAGLWAALRIGAAALPAQASTMIVNGSLKSGVPGCTAGLTNGVPGAAVGVWTEVRNIFRVVQAGSDALSFAAGGPLPGAAFFLAACRFRGPGRATPVDPLRGRAFVRRFG